MSGKSVLVIFLLAGATVWAWQAGMVDIDADGSSVELQFGSAAESTPTPRANTAASDTRTASPEPTPSQSGENTPTRTATETEQAVEEDTPEPEPSYILDVVNCVKEGKMFGSGVTVSCAVEVSNNGDAGGSPTIQMEVTEDISPQPSSSKSIEIGPETEKDILLEVEIPGEYVESHDGAALFFYLEDGEYDARASEDIYF